MGSISLVLGSQWGDEGKGKLVDSMSSEVKLCARAAGGHNAGHSISANGVSYSFHLLPSGLMSPETMCLIGTGTVIHLPTFFKELAELEKKGLQNVHSRLLVSDRATVDLDLHIAVDGLEEVELGLRKIGTTGRGIGPSYSTKAARSGLKVAEIFDKEVFEAKLRKLAAGFSKRYGDLFKYDVEDELKRFDEYRGKFAPYVVDAVSLMKQAQDNNTPTLVEGANALMLDIDYGTYPYVTSSNTGLGGCVSGLALNPLKIKDVIGVVKAYTTRVGSGPFATEDTGEIGKKLQDVGREFGTTTGRHRRCGWLDLVVVKYSTYVNHYTAINLTKLDVLDSFPTIKVAVAYKDKESGEELPSFPASVSQLERVEVVYKELPGWNKPTTSSKTYYDLPKEARAYVEFIEDFIGVKVRWIGTGPDRDAMIARGV